MGRQKIYLATIKDIIRENPIDTPNFQTVVRLFESGAEIMGTEDPVLIRRIDAEKRKLSHLEGRKKSQGVRNFNRWLVETAPQRDRFIARTIAQTLEQGEEGILDIGFKHDVQAYLPKGIYTYTPEIILSHVTEEDLRLIGAWEHYLRHFRYNKH